jgi:DNA-binding IclR family transcriptional regulator
LQRVRGHIDETRARGFSLSDGHITPGMAAVGAPIYNHRGELEGAISVSGLREPVVSDLARTGLLVRQAARETSARLGAEVNR